MKSNAAKCILAITILILVILISACSTDKQITENSNADLSDSHLSDDAKAILAALGDCTPYDISFVYGDYPDVDKNTLYETLINAIKNSSYEDYIGPTHFALSFSLDDKQENTFHLFSGLKKGLVEIAHFTEDKGNRVIINDSKLYETVLLTSPAKKRDLDIDFTIYQEILHNRAQKTVDKTSDYYLNQRLDGYEIVTFKLAKQIEDNDNTYKIYLWEPVFYPTDVNSFPLVGGMSLDSELRIKGYEQYNYFVVKNPGQKNQDYRFLFWDLFIPDDPAINEDENLIIKLRNAFKKPIADN